MFSRIIENLGDGVQACFLEDKINWFLLDSTLPKIQGKVYVTNHEG
jgi:hypothetical protein